MVCPRSSLVRFVMHYDAIAGRCHGAAIEVIIPKEVSVGGKFWINSGLAEEVQSDGGLIKKSVHSLTGKLGSVVEKTATK